MADRERLARDIVESFNANNWDKMESQLTTDSVYHELGTQRTMRGWDEQLPAWKGWKEAMPDVKGIVTSSMAFGDTAVIEVRWEGTHTGPLQTPSGPIPASGKRQITPSAWIFEFQGDQVKESRNYFDIATLLQQIGAM